MIQVNLENAELKNERIEIGADAVYFLGPKLTLRNCTLVLRGAARNLVIPQARFIDCTFEAKRELKGFLWDKAYLENCQFTGSFRGNDFGEWPYSPGKGSIEGGDFSQARLDACRFLGCDVRALRFPSWPCFTLVDPVGRWRELSTQPWPGDIGPVVMAGLAQDPPSTAAMTYSATALAKRSGTTPEAIKAVLEKIEGVLL
ncbi:hypothetical protein SAMN05444354_107258 [Stigmatella aurantiaca]|uniref:Pentapeptide repeat-containing protein n=1 Tax=Stigmatella aurantiaca TaxID=41 RepID=A0A1H7S006_STIAU|nr:hypothetical protein [Stigmatella aurantiaca]SEL65901.1 hypothetical protein SAMN05444354_107258 [Stigmatella aurantiaca]